MRGWGGEEGEGLRGEVWVVSEGGRMVRGLDGLKGELVWMRFWRLGIGIRIGVWFYGVMSRSLAEGYMSGLEFAYTLDFRISQ